MKNVNLSIIPIIVVVCTSCLVLSDAYAQDCMGGQYCGGKIQSATPVENRNVTVSLNFYSNYTMSDNVHYLWLRFFDAKNDTLIKNVSFFINATKDDTVLMHELFYTKTGLMTMKFFPSNDTQKLIINGTSEPTLGGWMSKNDTLPITTSAFTKNGTYHIHLEVLAIDYPNNIIDQSNPPTFDSWWSVDDKGNISQYENSTTVSIETLSHVIKNMSPLQQVKSGATASDIVCKDGSYLALTSYNRELVCLKAGTISKLASRGFLYGTSVGNTNYTTVLISPESENQASHNSYSPGIVTIMLGVNNTVRWVNQDDVANTIVPDIPLIQNGKSFGSDGVIKPDQSYTFTFTEPGTFAYHTEPHPWMKGIVIVLSPSNQITSAKNNDPFGITALIIYHPPDACLNPSSHSIPYGMPSCPPNKFYLKINSNSTAYLMGYRICDGNSCATNNTLSLTLPLNTGLNPAYQMIGLPVNLPWTYGDTIGIQLYMSSTNDNKTASLVNLGDSKIVP
ncbi:MAG: cupredoxin domain-containing protein [Nitrosotalea sp.]